jgi:cyanophycinase
MRGSVALVGAGEFLPAMSPFDRELLDAGGSNRPRVAIVPTAAYPDGEETFQRWASLGVEHFTAIGAEVEAVLIRNREDAEDPANAQAVGEADLIYFSGGKPGYLLDALSDSAVWSAALAANERGAVLAGCSAGAMVLGGCQVNLHRVMLPWPLRWRPALGVVPGIAVFPHYNAWPEPFTALMALQAPEGTIVLGIDEGTALVGRQGGWQVYGEARVTVWRGRQRQRHRAGESFRL